MKTSSLTSRFRRFRHRIKHERGAVLVEAAICIPLLLIVILGSVEAGTAWEAKSSTVSGVRTGVLRASTIGDRPETDMRIIQSVIGEVGAENTPGLEWIMVFEAEGDPDAKYNTCLGGNDTNPAGGIGCVVYNNAFIDAVANTTDPIAFQDTNFDTGIGGTPDPLTGENTSYTCDTTKVDAAWCAGLRTIGGDTQIGVAIRFNHEWTTGIFPFDAPVFQEYVISSTFSAGGSDIVPSAPVATPFGAGTLINTDFGSGFDPTSLGPDVSVNTNQVATSPSGEEFLGQFSTGTITIDLENQTPGYEVCVSFDLLVIDSWDLYPGSGQWGPDSFTVELNGENGNSEVYDKDNQPASTEDNNLGYNKNKTIPLTVCDIVPSSGELSVSFIGDMIQSNTAHFGTHDESWGIDNLVITSAP